MRRDALAWISVGVVLLLLFLGAWGLMRPQLQSTTIVQLGDAVITAEVAQTASSLQLGLGGRDELPARSGLLMVFDRDEKWPIWMRGMRFPLDIVWLDSQKRVVDVAADISPDTYPRSFKPSVVARYVLELPAGTASKQNIVTGRVASFTLK